MRFFIPAALLVAASCGDLKFDENLPTSPNSPPPGSTTSLGSLSAVVDNEQFNAPLQTPAIWRNESFGFTAINASNLTRILGISLRLPGPGTYTVGSIYSPVVSYIEMDGTTTYRWFTNSRNGAGSVTVSFLSSESASGHFSVELVPDSATKEAGFTAIKYVTGGTFNVAVMR
jgi:hypothetical protein